MNEENKYSYTYSAKEQDEIKKIREKYSSNEEDKMEQLRRLDKSVTKKGTMISIIIGVIGSLILGTGMSLITVWGQEMAVFIAGLIIGVIGLAGVAIAYPVYLYITKKEKERIAPEILRLTDELIK